MMAVRKNNGDIALLLSLSPLIVFLVTSPIFVFITIIALRSRGSWLFPILMTVDILLISMFTFSLFIALPVGLHLLSTGKRIPHVKK